MEHWNVELTISYLLSKYILSILFLQHCIQTTGEARLFETPFIEQRCIQ